MCTEIEAKLKVDSIKQIEDRLKQLGAEFIEEQQQTDYYFDDENRTLTKADKCLRLRREIVRNSETRFLTYKGPKQKDNYKKRKEIEIKITTPDAVRILLNELGYKIACTVGKKRIIWKFQNCIVALDSLPSLGSFVEIEGPDNRQIENVQKKLELHNLKHITQSYAELNENKSL